MDLHNPVVIVPIQPVDEDTKQKAAKRFPLLRKSKKLGRRQLAQKQEEWAAVYAGIALAKQLGGQLRIPTGNRGGINHTLRRCVLAAAVDVGVLDVLPRANTNVRKRYVPGKKWRRKSGFETEQKT